MVPDDISQWNLLSALDGARLAYFDGRLTETALILAQEVIVIILTICHFRYLLVINHTALFVK